MKKRSIVFKGKKSSISLEPKFWEAFRTMAREEAITLHQLANQLDATRQPAQNLSSAIRVAMLTREQSKLANLRAFHGT